MKHLTILLAGLLVLLSAGCTAERKPAFPVDRSKPESILRAYFDAWERSDWALQASCMDKKYGGMVPEPVE